MKNKINIFLILISINCFGNLNGGDIYLKNSNQKLSEVIGSESKIENNNISNLENFDIKKNRVYGTIKDTNILEDEDKKTLGLGTFMGNVSFGAIYDQKKIDVNNEFNYKNLLDGLGINIGVKLGGNKSLTNPKISEDFLKKNPDFSVLSLNKTKKDIKSNLELVTKNLSENRISEITDTALSISKFSNDAKINFITDNEKGNNEENKSNMVKIKKTNEILKRYSSEMKNKYGVLENVKILKSLNYIDEDKNHKKDKVILDFNKN